MQKILAIVMALLIIGMPTVGQAQQDGEVYTALGDSLAAGMNEHGIIGKGYADYIAGYLQQQGQLASFNKGFAYSGYTTQNVLADIAANVEKPINGIGESATSLQTALAQSSMITLSVGANDLLQTLQALQIDVSQGVPADAAPKIMEMVRQVAVANAKIIEQIQAINEDATIYVLGYYNPFPYLSADLQMQIAPLVTQMNAAVAQTVEGTGAIFVDVKDAVAADYQTYLPNPANIHLSEAGYKMVAQLVIEKFTTEATPELFVDMVGHWATDVVMQATALGLVKGYENNTFKPEQTLTRAQAAIIIARALQVPATIEAPFTDIANVAPESKAYINAAHQLGIIKGVNGQFKPNEPVTRAQLALMINRSYFVATGGSYVPKKPLAFTDVANATVEVKQAVAMVAELGIASGYGDKYLPNQFVTRAQAAKMLVTTVKLVK